MSLAQAFQRQEHASQEIHNAVGKLQSDWQRTGGQAGVHLNLPPNYSVDAYIEDSAHRGIGGSVPRKIASAAIAKNGGYDAETAAPKPIYGRIQS